MKRLNGFSLAEVIISITIIGVIASLTLPTLNNNVQKQQAGTILAKAISNLEYANQRLLQETNSRNIPEACVISPAQFTADGYLACLAKKNVLFLNVNKNQYKVTTKNFAATHAGLMAYDAKDRISFSKTSQPKVITALGAKTKDYGRFIELYIDVNGSANKPNILGKDVFVVLVDLRGRVIPYGGLSSQSYLASETVAWETSCPNETVEGEEAEEALDGKACAGNIADNGWKILYNY